MAGQIGTWNVDFTKAVPDGALGNQAQKGIFFDDDRGDIQRLVEAEGHEIAYNPETVEMNLIGQEAAESAIRTYNLSFDKDIRITKGKPNYEFFANWARIRPSGENAKLQIYLVDFRLEEIGTDHNKYYAESMTVTCTINTANETDGILSVSFAQAGDFTTGIMARTDTSTSDDPSTYIYGFTPATRIAVTGVETSVGTVEITAGDLAVVAVSFSPLGCPFDFSFVSDDPDVCVVERRRQSIIIRGRGAGTATVTVTSTADDTQKAEIEVTVN